MTTIKNKLSDNWATPQDLFDVLNKGGEYMGIHFDGFHFDIDLCATTENSKCYAYGTDYLYDEFMTKKNELLIFSGYKLGIDWAKGSTCFMNPPYSDPKPFIEKAWRDSKHCKIVCLVKCDPSTKWWGVFWDYEGNTAKPGAEVKFFPKRIKFCPPIGYSGKVSSPSFPSALVIFDRRICE